MALEECPEPTNLVCPVSQWSLKLFKLYSYYTGISVWVLRAYFRIYSHAPEVAITR